MGTIMARTVWTGMAMWFLIMYLLSMTAIFNIFMVFGFIGTIGTCVVLSWVFWWKVDLWQSSRD